MSGTALEPPLDGSRHERRVTALAAAAQLVVILDFSLILPLGPDLVEPLAIPSSALGAPLAVYAAAAVLSGLSLAPILDRYDRRHALLAVLVGLTLASASTCLATGFASLLALRTIAGLLAAPTSALLMALVTDEIPVERRGRALGRVIGANAVAGVIGIPAALWLAGRFGWWMGFALVAAVGVAVSVTVAIHLRGTPRRRLLAQPGIPTPTNEARDPTALLAHALIFLAFAAVVPITANISAYVQFNLGFPRASIPPLYMGGAALALVTMAVTGAAVDRWGSPRVGTLAIALLIGAVTALLVLELPWLSVELAFVLMLAGIGSRNVSFRTLTSRVPEGRSRARFMAHQAAARQLGSVSGALFGVMLLDQQADGQLVGMPRVALVCVALLVLLPPVLLHIDRQLDARRV